MTQNPYTTEKLLESLFGSSSYDYKNLSIEEVTALKYLRYSTIDWDLLLSKGLITKDDVYKRVAIYKQLLALDNELTNRQQRPKPKFKKGNALKTTIGTILIIDVTLDDNIVALYAIVDENGKKDHKSEENLLKILKG